MDGGGSHSSDDLDLGPGLGPGLGLEHGLDQGQGQGLGLDKAGYPMNHHGTTEGEGDMGSLEESSHWDDLMGEGNDGDSYTLGNEGVGGNSQYLNGLGMAQGMGGSMAHHGLQRVPYQERYYHHPTLLISPNPLGTTV